MKEKSLLVALLALARFRTAVSEDADCTRLGITFVNATEIDLRWTEPCGVSDSNDIQYYQYEATGALDESPDVTKRSDCHELVCDEIIQNLRSCIDYTITFIAVLIDDSKITYNNSYTTTLEQVPGSPLKLSEIGKNSTSVLLEWTPPRTHKECVHHYKVCYIEQPESKRAEKICEDTQYIEPENWSKNVTHTISGLEPCAEYKFMVQAVTGSNRVGMEMSITTTTGFAEPSDPVGFKVIEMRSKEAVLCWNKPLRNPRCFAEFWTSWRPCKSEDDLKNEMMIAETTDWPTTTPKWPTATPEWPTATPEWPTATPEWPTATPEWPTTTPEWTTTTTKITSTTTPSIESCDFYQIEGGLRSCTCYNFSLIAKSADGQFSSSQLFTDGTSLTTEDDLPAPEFVNVQGVTADKAFVSWSAPETDFNCVEGYEVSWKWSEGSDSKTSEKDVTSISIDGLSPCTQYETYVETIPKGRLTMSEIVHFNSSDEAPGQATKVAILSIDSSGFSAYWCPPTTNPQCADRWSITVTSLGSDLVNSNIENCPVGRHLVLDERCVTQEIRGLDSGTNYLFKVVPISPLGLNGRPYDCLITTST